MKISIANNRSKQSANQLQKEQISAIDKQNYAKSNPATTSTHSDYMPKSKRYYDTKAHETIQTENDIIDTEVVVPTKPKHSTAFNMRLTKKCKNCGEIISINDNYCWHCKMTANNQYEQGHMLNQTIIIKEKRGCGCLNALVIIILLILLLPVILYLLGLLTLGAVFGTIIGI